MSMSATDELAILDEISTYPDQIKAVMIAEFLKTLERRLAEDGKPFSSLIVLEARSLVERMTKPLTLDDCRDVLNANKYAFVFTWEATGEWHVEGDYVCSDLIDDSDGESMVRLDLFEAAAIARAFLLKGGTE